MKTIKHYLTLGMISVVIIFTSCTKESSLGAPVDQEQIIPYDQNLSLEENMLKGASMDQILMNHEKRDVEGLEYKGGVVFHIDEQTRMAYIGAKEDLPGTYVWGEYGKSLGCRSANLSDDKKNCRTIINANATETAASACASAEINGYKDWYLPGRYALSEMLKEFRKTDWEIDGSRWTCTENCNLTSISGRIKEMSETSFSIPWGSSDKNRSYKVRPIRSINY